MPVTVQRLTPEQSPDMAELWQAATLARRRHLGLPDLAPDQGSALDRRGAFGVGAFERGDRRLLAAAVGIPARADDARSEQHVPGLAHISSVATHPGRWGEGLGGLVVRAVLSHAVRRGYARAQLWTQATSAAAHRLYEREGFVRSGRERADDHGEHIVHYLRDLPLLRVVARPAARMLCLDAEERLLLLHFRDPVDGHQLWEPPGGGLEAGESALEAVVREWAEETSLALPQMAATSTYVARDLVWRGKRWVTDERFFLGRTADIAPSIAPEGLDLGDECLGSAWVPWRELGSLPDPVEPDVLPPLRRLDPNGPWADRHRLGKS